MAAQLRVLVGACMRASRGCGATMATGSKHKRGIEATVRDRYALYQCGPEDGPVRCVQLSEGGLPGGSPLRHEQCGPIHSELTLSS